MRDHIGPTGTGSHTSSTQLAEHIDNHMAVTPMTLVDPVDGSMDYLTYALFGTSVAFSALMWAVDDARWGVAVIVTTIAAIAVIVRVLSRLDSDAAIPDDVLDVLVDIDEGVPAYAYAER